jgi:hypothetical protein
MVPDSYFILLLGESPTYFVLIRFLRFLLSRCVDWDDAQTELKHLGGAAPGAAASGGNKLWEDNWDDDDVEEDFSVQLRWVFKPMISGLRSSSL